MISKTCKLQAKLLIIQAFIQELMVATEKMIMQKECV